MIRPVALLSSATAIGAALVLAAGAQASPHPNPAAITINDCANPCTTPGTATPYPSPIPVAGETNLITKATVTLTGFTHTSPDEVDVLFASPTRTIILMSDAGGSNGATALNFTFDQTAANFLPDNTALSSGTFKPTNNPPSPLTVCAAVDPSETFPAPAPAPPYSGSNLNALVKEAPNGTYNLYVVDDCFGDTGSISGGWTVTLTTGNPPTAVALRSFVGYAHPHSVDLRWHTASEPGLLGFNVVRFAGNRTVQVNRALIRAKAAGSIADAAYRFVDRSVSPGNQYLYRLQAVRVDGSKSWLGTAGVRTAG